MATNQMVKILAIHPDNSTDIIEQPPNDCAFFNMFERYHLNHAFGFISWNKPSKTKWTFHCCGFKYVKEHGGSQPYTKDGGIYEILINRIEPQCKKWHKHTTPCYTEDISNPNLHARLFVKRGIDKYDHCTGDFYIIKKHAETGYLMDMTKEEYVEMFEFFSKLKK